MLAFLNIVIGVWFALLFSERNEENGQALDAHTFPELLGRRYNSRFCTRVFPALLYLFYACLHSGILIGIARFIEVYLNIPFATALLGFLLITACYVLWEGSRVYCTRLFFRAL
jgi:SSS family solute:Na+ symporter